MRVVGDAAGVRGVAAAPMSGELAAIEIAYALGHIDGPSRKRESRPFLSQLGRASRFARAMGGLTAIRPGLIEDIPAEAIVCRCEDVTRAAIDEAARSGCREINQVKAATRCGMGPCQGRMCGDTASLLWIEACQAAIREGREIKVRYTADGV